MRRFGVGIRTGGINPAQFRNGPFYRRGMFSADFQLRHTLLVCLAGRLGNENTYLRTGRLKGPKMAGGWE